MLLAGEISAARLAICVVNARFVHLSHPCPILFVSHSFPHGPPGHHHEQGLDSHPRKGMLTTKHRLNVAGAGPNVIAAPDWPRTASFQSRDLGLLNPGPSIGLDPRCMTDLSTLTLRHTALATTATAPTPTTSAIANMRPPKSDPAALCGVRVPVTTARTRAPAVSSLGPKLPRLAMRPSTIIISQHPP